MSQFSVKKVKVNPEGKSVVAEVESREPINGHAGSLRTLQRKFNATHRDRPHLALDVGNRRILLTRMGKSQDLTEFHILANLQYLDIGEVTPIKPPKKTAPRMTRLEKTRWRPASRR